MPGAARRFRPGARNRHRGEGGGSPGGVDRARRRGGRDLPHLVARLRGADHRRGGRASAITASFSWRTARWTVCAPALRCARPAGRCWPRWASGFSVGSSTGSGRPIDSKGPLEGTVQVPVAVRPPHPLERELIREPLGTGIRSIDGFTTVGRGQRIGIFAGSGVGKSVLLGTIARRTDAEVIVVALVGERGREVREFLERDLTAEGLGPLGRGGGDLGAAAAGAGQGGPPGHPHRRAFPRSRAARAADDGLAHPLRHGAARGRSPRRRAADDEGLHPVVFRRTGRSCSSAPAWATADR